MLCIKINKFYLLGIILSFQENTMSKNGLKYKNYIKEHNTFLNLINQLIPRKSEKKKKKI